MRDLVIIPTYCRPEYLYLALEHIEHAAADRELDIRVFHDRHRDDGPQVIKDLAATRETVAAFAGRLQVTLKERGPHSYIGNVLNVMEAYQEAAAAPDVRYVYQIEDDVLVAPDFFRWHEAMQARGDYFCTVGWHCIRNAAVRASSDPAAYIESARDLSSIGLCWRREKLSPIIQHATADYYRNHLAGYMRRHFPLSGIPDNQWTEQAGLIFRIMLANPSNVTAWPALKRCAHIGINGYHRPRGHKFTGRLAQRIAALRSALAHGQLCAMANEATEDLSMLEAIPAWQPDELYRVQHFEAARYA